MRRLWLVFAGLAAVTAVYACTNERQPPSTTPTGGIPIAMGGSGPGGAGGAGPSTTSTSSSSTSSATGSAASTGSGICPTVTCNPACTGTDKCVDIQACDGIGACSNGDVMAPCGGDSDCFNYLVCTNHRCECKTTSCSQCSMTEACIDIGNCAFNCSDGTAGAFCKTSANCVVPLMCTNHQCQ